MIIPLTLAVTFPKGHTDIKTVLIHTSVIIVSTLAVTFSKGHEEVQTAESYYGICLQCCCSEAGKYFTERASIWQGAINHQLCVFLPSFPSNCRQRSVNIYIEKKTVKLISSQSVSHHSLTSLNLCSLVLYRQICFQERFSVFCVCIVVRRKLLVLQGFYFFLPHDLTTFLSSAKQGLKGTCENYHMVYFVGWLVSRLVSRSFGWLAACRLDGWLAGWSVDWLLDWLGVGQVSWLVG